MATKRDELDGQPVREWDTGTGLYREFDAAGAVTLQRALTPDEADTLQPPPPDPAVTIEQAQAAIAGATTVAALRAAALKLAEAIST